LPPHLLQSPRRPLAGRDRLRACAAAAACRLAAARKNAGHSAMSYYHVLHCVPHPRMHGLNGYKEVIETVSWGLQRLGHQVSYAVNGAATDAINIVFGAQVMPIAMLSQLPENTIIYNFEQLRGLPPDRIKDEAKYYAKAEQFSIWDYSEANLASWHALGRREVKIVPVGYAPILSRIPKPERQDIDVLIYGLAGERRLQVFHALSQSGLCTVFVSGLYGPARDDLISRAKVVLNVNLYQRARIFEVVRVSYLLANRKAVVADLESDTSVDDDLRAAVRFGSSVQELVQGCVTLVDNEAERTKLEESGFAAISRRDIVGILAAALQS
jgi:hypothetical protein